MECNGMECNGMEWNGMEWNVMEWNVMYVCVYLHIYTNLGHGKSSKSLEHDLVLNQP